MEHKTRPPKPKIQGERLQAVLALNRLTMRGIAERCGVTHSTISKICSGHRKPSGSLLRVMRDELGAEQFAYVTGQLDTLTPAAAGGSA